MRIPYTPKPWTIQYSTINNVEKQINIVQFHKRISEQDTEHQANAKLIALAPELVDALDNLVGAFETNVQDCEKWIHYQNALALLRQLEITLTLDKPLMNPKYYKYWIGNFPKLIVIKTRKQLNKALSDKSLSVCRLDKLMGYKERFDHEKGWVKYHQG